MHERGGGGDGINLQEVSKIQRIHSLFKNRGRFRFLLPQHPSLLYFFRRRSLPFLSLLSPPHFTVCLSQGAIYALVCLSETIYIFFALQPAMNVRS